MRFLQLFSSFLVLSLLTPTVFAFSDIGDSTLYKESIASLQNVGVISGYPDGSYRPLANINRAELAKIVVKAAYEEDFDTYTNKDCFEDVAPGLWYTPYVCFAEEKGIIKGYGDGLFRPDQAISYVEALKISMLSFGFEYKEGSPWFEHIAQTALERGFVPQDIEFYEQELNRGQMADLIVKVISDGEFSNDSVILLASETENSMNEEILSLINAHRQNAGLSILILDPQLSAVALAHSIWMDDNDTLSHTGINGTSPFDRCAAAGTTCLSENVALHSMNTAQNFFDLWKNSPGHNTNMLGSHSKIGIGVDGIYATTVFF